MTPTFFREADVGLPHTPFNVGSQIGLAVAGEVHIHLARSEIQIQPCKRNISKMEVSLSRAHIHFQLQREFLAEM